MSQTRTSAATSINRTKLPAVYTRHQFPAGSVVIDFGCGRYTDHIRDRLAGCEYIGIDKYNRTDDQNTAAYTRIFEIRNARTRPQLYVICSNVLNVIDDDAAINDLVSEMIWTAETTGDPDQTEILVTVYEGDRTGTGRETGPDQWQRNERTRDYLRFFPEGARISMQTIIYKP